MHSLMNALPLIEVAEIETIEMTAPALPVIEVEELEAEEVELTLPVADLDLAA